ncbi:hypothetical protein [Streptococcus phage Str-PAP-1]|uniref:Uncharacterized protein n=1 Tax=Streptococcus parauberis KRS-02083 TaxID=1207545 RepID=A0ABP2T0P3_9STRE|nr:hypothetical protein [Streptococcus parauberis]YP_009188508.1 hypothetical protein AU157_gp54 [Streptococcus phage Str-PAP-1]QBX18117.1 hypothetical protein Javan393_0037 [Streptococcus phage Javan393]AJD83122.1 hypothetical protein [Streptococcus phage Str-PAP-1]EMG26271.1 hypothetical protein SPJ1_0233 [Streptococcus parauberis KRS-02083]WEM65793.1 hypothetical protein P1T45_04070 [Streptococcus parauberis]WOF47673.1 hypothetical protein K7G42_03990 [Streptococcus parauberis]
MDNELYKRDLEILGKNGQLNIVIDGYNAVIVMIQGWHLCGYVEVPENIVGLIDENEIECHGGITFNAGGVKYFPTNGYYIGFDCAHGWDWTPVSPYGEYRDINYVKEEIKYIIQQLKEVMNG